MGSVKEAFRRVKEDINSLKDEMFYLKKEISGLREEINKVKNVKDYSDNIIQKKQNEQPDTPFNSDLDNSTHPSTDRQINSTVSTHPSTHNSRFKPLNSQNLGISTGNKGVSTDRQTDRQTHRQEDYANFRQPNYSKEDYDNSQPEISDFRENTKQNNLQNQIPKENISGNYLPNQSRTPSSPQHSQPSPLSQQQNSGSFQMPAQNKEINNETNNEQTSMNNALEILNSLDSIKKEIRFKFKKLTEQEMIVFSTLYQLNEENEIANYKSISRRLNLSESSIRDYIGRLMKKGIPIEKKRINNKNIHLNISQELKKIATLPTILKLRDL